MWLIFLGKADKNFCDSGFCYTLLAVQVFLGYLLDFREE